MRRLFKKNKGGGGGGGGGGTGNYAGIIVLSV